MQAFADALDRHLAHHAETVSHSEDGVRRRRVDALFSLAPQDVARDGMQPVTPLAPYIKYRNARSTHSTIKLKSSPM